MVYENVINVNGTLRIRIVPLEHDCYTISISSGIGSATVPVVF